MDDRTKLSDEEIQKRLEAMPGWRADGDTLRRDYVFKDFLAAFGFISQVALLAERHDHHPEIWNVWNQVKVGWSTHDSGGITATDFRLAQACDEAA